MRILVLIMITIGASIMSGQIADEALSVALEMKNPVQVRAALEQFAGHEGPIDITMHLNKLADWWYEDDSWWHAALLYGAALAAASKLALGAISAHMFLCDAVMKQQQHSAYFAIGSSVASIGWLSVAVGLIAAEKSHVRRTNYLYQQLAHMLVVSQRTVVNNDKLTPRAKYLLTLAHHDTAVYP